MPWATSPIPSGSSPSPQMMAHEAECSLGDGRCPLDSGSHIDNVMVVGMGMGMVVGMGMGMGVGMGMVMVSIDTRTREYRQRTNVVETL